MNIRNAHYNQSCVEQLNRLLLTWERCARVRLVPAATSLTHV